jgi:hypothetical protein
LRNIGERKQPGFIKRLNSRKSDAAEVREICTSRLPVSDETSQVPVQAVTKNEVFTS